MRIPEILMIVLLSLSLAVDIVLFFDIRHWRRGSKHFKAWMWGYAILSAICYAMLIAAVVMPRRNAAESIIPVMWILYTWLTVFAVKVLTAIGALVGMIPLLWKGKRWKAGRYTGLGVGLTLFIIMWTGVFYTRRHIEVTTADIVAENLPAGFDGYKIVQFSDSHVGTWVNDTTFISKLVDEINAQNPDLIVFTGDIVNRQSSELEPFTSVFSRLKAKDGVYSVLGNHDYGDYINWPTAEAKKENLDRLIDMQRQMGWNLLIDSTAVLSRDDDEIALAGVGNWGEPPFKSYGDLNRALPVSPSTSDKFGQNDGKFKILLTHNPLHWKYIVEPFTDIALTLSGHTHAMQMMIGSLSGARWSPATYKYPQWGGLYEGEKENSRLYVNIGTGQVGMPSRLLGAYPEITVLTLKTEKKGPR